ncbi:translocation/assembly module TamB domain-containing protein [Streptomyces goshikiensis]|uniref:hypothetical protein n=1 Tax=Streptomyces goshikiensis TaxID=1942 RepID=UPI002ADF91FF|nr:hypothetical protein [Streptomyces goshikiensis]
MTTPELPMLLPPTKEESPSPLRVSTFAKPEYADLTFIYGKNKAGSATWPVHCKEFKVRIPTGRQASALTSEPALIRHELTVPAGKREWSVDRDTRDPNQTVFTCTPPPGDPAAFDGTWQVELKLWGIEVNGGVGPVGIVWEESTSTTGPNGQYQGRIGRGEVSKRDDSFYLHSFRPASVAISRNTKPVLHWEGTANATYTMYYRKPNGTQGSSPATGGSWTSPESLVDDGSFTLEAKMGNEVRYLTTYVKVNNPDIAVTGITADGITTLNGAAHLNGATTTKNLTVNAANTLYAQTIEGNGTSGALKIGGKLTLSTAAGEVNVASKLTVTGVTTLNGAAGLNGATTTKDLTVNKANTLHVRTIEGSGDYGSLAIGGRLTLSTEGREVNIASTLTVAGATTLKGATTTKNLTVDPGADGYLWLKTGRFDTAAAATVNTFGPLNAKGPTALSGTISGLFPAVTKLAWNGNVYSYAVPADMIAVVRDESGKKQFINSWYGGVELFNIGLDAWEVVCVPLRKGAVFQKTTTAGNQRLDVWLFHVGAKQ